MAAFVTGAAAWLVQVTASFKSSFELVNKVERRAVLRTSGCDFQNSFAKKKKAGRRCGKGGGPELTGALDEGFGRRRVWCSCGGR